MLPANAKRMASPGFLKSMLTCVWIVRKRGQGQVVREEAREYLRIHECTIFGNTFVVKFIFAAKALIFLEH